MKRLTVFIFCICFFVGILSFGTKALCSKSSVVINGDTGEVLFSQNPELPLPMASTTKIMTALILCKSGNLRREITVPKEAVLTEGTSMGLKAGDKITLKDLLYGMMLPSGNDAANTVAIALGGSIENFVDMMNKEAFLLGLEDTLFETPSGLDKGNHHTTALDLALITKEAMKYKDFSEVVASETAKVYFGEPKIRYTLKNHNRLVREYDDIVGVKTGFTKKAGRCLVTAAKKDGKYVIAVTLNDPDDWKDHRSLIDTGFEKLKKTTVFKGGKTFCVPIAGDSRQDIKVTVKEFSFFTAGEKISAEVFLPRFLYLPLKRGEVIGKAVYKSENKILKTENIICNQSMNEKTRNINTYKEILLTILRSLNERQ